MLYHALRDVQRTKEVNSKHCKLDYQVNDSMTKALPK